MRRRHFVQATALLPASRGLAAAAAVQKRIGRASHGGGDANLNMLLAMPNAIYMETSGPRRAW